MKKICKNCRAEFLIEKDDERFYKKIKVPSPRLCPSCRQQRRLSFRNERSLYHRNCDSSNKKIISIYSSDKSFPVFENNFWWSDNWDAKTYGKDFNFNKNFFEQFFSLLKEVPKMARIQQGENENSKFCNCASYNKNSYLIFSGNQNEDCLYGTFVNMSKNCLDNFYIINSELCYECINCDNCYDLIFSQNCKNCSGSAFLKNCLGCTDCFACINLQNKKYHFLNKEYSKEEYLKKISTLSLDTFSNLKISRENFSKFCTKFPHKYMEGIINENCSGNFISNSKNSICCFDSDNLEDCSYCSSSQNIKNCLDVDHYGATQTNELLYECEGVGHGAFNIKFSKLVWGGSSDIDYCYECFSSKDCFGCTGLKKSQFCILNKQYSREEYFSLRDKIIEHMKQTGEWGEFFPIELSPFGYNETVAAEYFPLSKNEVLAKNWKWKEDEEQAKYFGEKYEIPEKITETSDEILQKILICESCEKNYRIVTSELKFYRKKNLPIPRNCPNCRHSARMKLRNPRKLFTRNCDNCKVEISTSFSPERPEKVFCEKCYLESLE